MTRSRLIVFRLVTVLGGLAVVLAGVVGVELYATSRIRDAGWNVRGYRGRILHAKAPNEIRVFAIGGSTTYGYTVGPEETYPAQLEAMLNQRFAPQGIVVSVANLGHLSDSSVCYAPTYRDYAYLKPDVAIVYEGYNDAGRNFRRTELDCYRQSSAIFRATGFFPTSPIFLWERWYKLRYGNIDEGYRRRQEAFAQANKDKPKAPSRILSAEEAYQTYERNVVAFVELVLGDGRSLTFASQPYLGKRAHLEQQTRIRVALAPSMPNPRFRYRDFLYLFGGKYDPAWFNSDMWLNPRGNGVLAERLAEPVAELIAAELARRRP